MLGFFTHAQAVSTRLSFSGEPGYEASPTYTYLDDRTSTNHIGVWKINVVFSTLSEVHTCILTIPTMCAAHIKCKIVQSLFAATQRSS